MYFVKIFGLPEKLRVKFYEITVKITVIFYSVFTQGNIFWFHVDLSLFIFLWDVWIPH